MMRLLTCVLASGLGSEVQANDADADGQRRFRGIGCLLVVDAVPGAEMRGVVFDDDRGHMVYASSLVARRNRSISDLGGTRIPLTLRAVWRDNPKPVWGRLGAIEFEGTIIGDYTIPVAERIPDALLDDIRSNGGALRLKFRLKPDGVLFAWDIERSVPIPGCRIERVATCRATAFFLPGGDFPDTKY